MSSLNKVVLIGNVGQTIKMSTTKDGVRIANLSLATHEGWKDKVTGEKKTKTEWHRIVVMNERIVDLIDRFVRIGSRIYIEGQLQTRKWTDQLGHEKYSTEVIVGRFKGEILLLDRKESLDEETESTDSLVDKPSSGSQTAFKGETIQDDDIPF